ncbi:PDDEXK family nuclease [Herbiconiux sp. SYSU D00978]|uniref:hypothetical protein n=1 Tax=Herbiconiux sp. SYSU D00978 TaxID=2812562 RepID=UPI001A97198E|nr:hypothetical protein [Herbiconiux sp. SYSU D00978]
MADIALDQIVFTRTLLTAGDRAAFYRRAADGDYVSLARGAYAGTADLARCLPEERHRAAVLALSALRRDLVFSSVSAALVWRRPWVGAPPKKPHALALGATSGRSTAGITRHVAAADEARIDVHGILVTPLARTLVDAARHTTLPSAVAMLDHALSPANPAETWPASARCTREDLAMEHERGSTRGGARARLAIGAASGASGSLGESVCRVLIAQLGFPAPVLQQEFRDADGLIGYTDFFWPELGLVVEFDGRAKYLRDEYTSGRSPGEIVLAEKRREDRLRARGLRVIRLDWEELRHPERVAARLERAGLVRAHVSAPQWLR